MDIRETEKVIWGKIWQDLDPNAENNDLYEHIRNYFIDMGHLRSSAKEKRFEEAVHIVLKKIWKMTPKSWRRRV